MTRGGEGAGRALALALSIAAIALPGMLTGSRGVADPCALLVWLALVAPAAGALAGGLRLAPWPHALAVPATWTVLLVWNDALAPRDLGSPAYAALALGGLFAAGYAAGRTAPVRARWTAASALLALAALLVIAPLGALYLRAPWPAPVAGILLDLSPATLLAECAGVDWLRHPAIYDAAGAVDLDPRVRGPYRPELAGPLAFVVGCALVLVADRLAQATRRRAAGEDAGHAA